MGKRICSVLGTAILAISLTVTSAQDCNKIALSIDGLSIRKEIPISILATADSLSFTEEGCRKFFRVYRFRLKLNDREYKAMSNRFTPEMKRELIKLKPGDSIEVFDVRTRDRENPEKVRLISDVGLKVISDN